MTDTVHGGTARDWHAAYLALRRSWQQLKGCGPAVDVYWPATRLPIHKPIHQPTDQKAS